MDPAKTCKDCRFFMAISTECRRHSPTAFLLRFDPKTGANSILGAFPGTKDTNWCGEFEQDVLKLN